MALTILRFVVFFAAENFLSLWQGFPEKAIIQSREIVFERRILLTVATTSMPQGYYKCHGDKIHCSVYGASDKGHASGACHREGPQHSK